MTRPSDDRPSGPDDRPGERMRLGLALSGGGFRASLFHIGVLARLAELDLLRRVEVLSCVSGGSIIGALYYLYLKRELDAQDDIPSARLVEIVHEMERHFLAVVQTNLRWQTFSNLWSNLKMARPDYSRSDRLGEVLDAKLYRPVWNGDRARPIEMRELRIAPRGDRSFHPETGNSGRHVKVPVLMLNATALNSGHNWRFESVRMGEPEPSPLERQLEKNIWLQSAPYRAMIERQMAMPLGIAVAASACVPGIFEPLAVSDLYPDPFDRSQPPGRLRVQLVDGGVHDNLGLEALRERDCTHYVVSDASGQMLDEVDPGIWLGAVVGRSSSILMDRVRELQLARLFDSAPGRVALMHLRRELEAVTTCPLAENEEPKPAPLPQDGCTGYRVDRTAQRLLAELRTDLDAFTDVEALALMADGYLMTARQFETLATPGLWPTLGAPSDRSAWRFAALFEKLGKPDPALLRQLDVARHRLFKLAKLSPTVRGASILGIGLAALAGIGLLMWETGSQAEYEWGFEQSDDAVLWLIIALLLAHPAYVGLRAAARKFDRLRWLAWPVGKIAQFGQICLAPFLWLLAQSQLVLFNDLFLRQGRLDTLGISPSDTDLSPPSATAATAPAEAARSGRAA